MIGPLGTVKQIGRGDLHVLAQPVELVGSGHPALNTSSAIGTSPGWATQVPSWPSVASRSLSSRTLRESRLVGLRDRS